MLKDGSINVKGKRENERSVQQMADEERIRVFLESFYRGAPEYLDRLEWDAVRDDVPIIRKNTQSVLRLLLEIKKPQTILEIGTAVGFSALFFCEYSAAHITTIENYEKRIPLAEKNFREAGMDSRITFLKGNAEDILPQLSGPYDMIFMDAAKGQYITFLPELKRLMHSGTVLAADNILQDGELLESRFAVERRNRTIHKRMREYLEAVTSDPELVTSIIPAGDGLAVSVRK